MRTLAALLLAACSADARLPTASPTATLNVLFVGNSLTYTNDLPGMLRALGDAGGVRIHAAAVAKPDYAIEDHYRDGEALAAIAGGGWNYVVMQQGPSALESSRANLLAWVDTFAIRIRAAGAGPALYQVWPPSARAGDFDRSLESYALAAQQVNGVLLPAGSAWRAAWAQDPALELYGPDGFHPSRAGTYLAALVIYGRLTGRSLAGLPALGLSPELARGLQLAAAEVLN